MLCIICSMLCTVTQQGRNVKLAVHASTLESVNFKQTNNKHGSLQTKILYIKQCLLYASLFYLSHVLQPVCLVHKVKTANSAQKRTNVFLKHIMKYQMQSYDVVGFAIHRITLCQNHDPTQTEKIFSVAQFFFTGKNFSCSWDARSTHFELETMNDCAPMAYKPIDVMEHVNVDCTYSGMFVSRN